MDTFETAFILTIRSFGRGFGGYEELMNESDLNVWNLADKFISSRTYNIRNEQIFLEIDWKPAIQYIDFWADIASSPQKINALMNNQLSKPKEIDPVKINITAIIPTTLKDCSQNEISYCIIHFIHEIFLIINLASPGCCNFGYSTISASDETWSETFDLSPYTFESAWHDSLKIKWPKITSFSLKLVFEWFNSLNIGTCEIATTPISKALFALLHIAHALDFEPGSLVWLAHALESLYDTPPALSYSFLKRRIAEFLHIPTKKEKWLNQKLRQFYDYRNAFVHGGMPIAHPIAVSCDNLEEKCYSELMEVIDFGSLLVIATLQEFVARRWKNIVYKEKIFGITI